jgi:hypothetical protein
LRRGQARLALQIHAAVRRRRQRAADTAPASPVEASWGCCYRPQAVCSKVRSRGCPTDEKGKEKGGKGQHNNISRYAVAPTHLGPHGRRQRVGLPLAVPTLRRGLGVHTHDQQSTVRNLVLFLLSVPSHIHPHTHTSFAVDPAYRDVEFQTTPEDRPLVAHFSANDPHELLAAALLVQDRCDAIDLVLRVPAALPFLLPSPYLITPMGCAPCRIWGVRSV